VWIFFPLSGRKGIPSGSGGARRGGEAVNFLEVLALMAPKLLEVERMQETNGDFGPHSASR
jgi:hypothetical protein